MADIKHRVGVKASVGAVYEALATTTGIAGWWTQEVNGTVEVGGRILRLPGRRWR